MSSDTAVTVIMCTCTCLCPHTTRYTSHASLIFIFIGFAALSSTERRRPRDCSWRRRTRLGVHVGECVSQRRGRSRGTVNGDEAHTSMEAKRTASATQRWALPAAADALIVGLSGSGKSLLRRQLIKLARLYASSSDAGTGDMHMRRRRSFTVRSACCACFSRAPRSNSVRDGGGDRGTTTTAVAESRVNGDDAASPCFSSFLPRLHNPVVSGLYPTVGVELDEVHLPLECRAAHKSVTDRGRVRRRGSSRPGRFMRLREVGGMMQPIWESYYTDCGMMLFVVDASADVREAGTQGLAQSVPFNTQYWLFIPFSCMLSSLQSGLSIAHRGNDPRRRCV